MPDIPETIGPYEVIRPIAQGGMAEVFEVRDPEGGERRALKLLMELKTSVKRFNREFEAMTRLNHPNIVRVYRYGYHGKHPWMSMELLRGTPLQVRVKSFGPPGTPERTTEVMRIGWYVATALQYIHDRGLVHRDLKSANVQVLRDGRVKLLDFGTAHLVDPLERITKEGDFVGTFSYAAPEQIVGARIDHRADLYATGVLLYRLLTGRRPFKAKDPHKVAHMHLHVEPRPIRELVPDLPQELEDLVTWLLQKQRKDRPQQADDIADALEAVAGDSLLRGQGLALYDDLSVGRAQEHREAWHDLETHPTAHLVTLCGGDAVERHRFLDQLQQDAVKRAVRVGRVDPAETGPRAVAHALAAALPAETAEDELIRHALGHDVGAGEPLWVTTLERLVPDALVRIQAAEIPVVLLADELPDRADATTAALATVLEQARATSAPVAVVATAATPDDDGLAALRKVSATHTALSLGSLDARRTALVVGNLLHRRPPPPSTAFHLLQATGGHPSLLSSVVEELVDGGTLHVRDDDRNRVDWRDGIPGALDVPQSVRQVLEERVGALAAPWRRVLEVIDTLGGRATVRQLALATGTRQTDIPQILEAMMEDGLVVWGGGVAQPVVAHDPLIARFVGADMRPVRRAAVQHVVADLIGNAEPRAAHVPLLLAVDRPEQAVDRAVTCARRAMLRGDVGEALQLLEIILPHADLPSLPDEQRVDVHLLYADVIQRIRPMEPKAVKSLEAASRLAEGTPRLAEVLYGRAEQQRGIGHYANHRKFLLEAWTLIEHEPATPLKARIALDLGHSFDYGAQIPQATSWFDTALEAARAVDDQTAADLATIGLGAMNVAQGEVEEAEASLDALIQARAHDEAGTVRWQAIAAWGHALRRQGRYSEAIPKLTHAVNEARDGQSLTAWAAVTLSAAAAELDLFRLGRAQELIEELAAALGAGERLHLRLETRLFQGRLELASGQSPTANFLLSEVVDQAEKAGLALLAELGRAYLAEARMAVGAEDEAKALYQKALLGLMGTGNQFALADAIVSRARAVGAKEDPTKAFRLVRRLLHRASMAPLRIEHLLAETRWFRSQGEETLVQQSLREAQTAMNRLASAQSDIEQAALRVHPWAHEVTLATQKG